MILKLKKGTVAFLNKELLYVDFKSVRLDRVLTNLFIKMYADGQPVQLAFRKEYTIDTLKSNLNALEEIQKGIYYRYTEVQSQCS